ncbi:MAG TPA: hypothetical protein VFW66_13785 [Gemmatimonadales bacterium]|nr:hypothetical protein [Gemmatimonadales bacterium]
MAESAGLNGFSNPFVRATAVGTILQVIMVVAGHTNPSIARLFPVLGTGIAGVAGLLSALWSRGAPMGAAAGGGAAVGGISAVLGVLVSIGLGDVPASTLGIAAVSSGLAGGLGGLVGQLFGRSARV